MSLVMTVTGLLIGVLATSVCGVTKAGLIIAPGAEVTRLALPATQDSTVYTIKEAGIQFDVPKGWKIEVDKDSKNVVLSIEDGAMTITFVVEEKFGEVATGMKDGLKERLANLKSDGEPKEDTHNGMVHISETGSGMLKDQSINWSIDVLKATQNLTILTFGIQKVMKAHEDEYIKFVGSIKKL